MSNTTERFTSKGATALHVAIDSGASPLDILEMHPVSGKVSARWLTVLYLLREYKMTAEDIATLLDVHPRAITKMLHNLDRLRKNDPKVMELIHQMMSSDVDGVSPFPAHARSLSTVDFDAEQQPMRKQR